MATASAALQRLYTPLLGASQTRIVHIQLGSQHAPFEAFHEVIDLDLRDAPSYNAISYCCGDPTPVSQVYLTDINKHLPIGQNLTDALTRVLNDGIPGPFWVDAISIDQNDIEEKNKQVRMMTRVFTTADQVLMWLGRDDGTLRRAIILLIRWSKPFNFVDQDRSNQALFEMSNGDRHFVAADYEQMRPLFEAMSDQDWAILRAFFDRPYWRRSWIVQEVTCGRGLQVLCDTVPAFSFEALAMAPFWLQHHAGFRLLEVGDDQGLRTSAGQSMRLSNLLNLRRGWQRQGGVHISRIFKAYSCESYDPRDRFFATQGIFDIPPDVKHHFVVDYGRPVWRVHAEAVRGIIQATKSLLVLTVSNHRLPVDQSFPSWVPRFDGRADDVAWDSDNEAWTQNITVSRNWPHSAPGTGPEVQEDANPRILSLLGIKYAHPIVIAMSLCPKGWLQGDVNDGPQVWEWFKWPAATVYLNLHSGPVWRNKREMAMIFAECTTAQYCCAQHLRRYSQNRTLILADFRAYLQAWADTVLSEEVTKAMHPRVAALKADLVAWDAEDAAVAAVVASTIPTEGTVIQEDAPEADMSRYYKAMVLQCSNKSLVITRDWRIGVGPLKTHKDDSVVAFFGAARPFVIRRQTAEEQRPGRTADIDSSQSQEPEEEQLSDRERNVQFPDMEDLSTQKRAEQWQLIGRGWLPGLMNGEALDGPGKEGEWFDLV